MIKRLHFVSRRAGLSLRDFSAAWLAAVTLTRNLPAGVRPLRAVACTTLHDVVEAPHDGIGIEWFADLNALRRFEAWLDSDEHRRAASVAGVIDPNASAVFVAEELVLRGADWLARRWVGAGPKLKHMALARRAPGLSAAEFSARWRDRAGTVGGGSAPAISIPDAAKGLAYVQNHSLEDRGTYDAVNEVYFDDREAMRSRVEFFANIDAGRSEADLVSAATFVAVEERVV